MNVIKSYESHNFLIKIRRSWFKHKVRHILSQATEVLLGALEVQIKYSLCCKPQFVAKKQLYSSTSVTNNRQVVRPSVTHDKAINSVTVGAYAGGISKWYLCQIPFRAWGGGNNR